MGAKESVADDRPEETMAPRHALYAAHEEHTL